jgi:N-acetylneuraminic acid mutarotase
MKKLSFILLSFLLSFAADAAVVWNQKANFGGLARHRSTAFSIGNKGYMGLGHYNSGVGGNIHLEDFWEYDPGSDSWTQKANFGGGLRYHAVGESYGNKAYVGTGRAPGNILMTDWWEFDPMANTWTTVTPFPGTPRRGAVIFKIDEFLFIGTGETASGYANDFYAYDAMNDLWLMGVQDFPGSQRTSAVGFAIEDKGYVGSGGIGCGTNDFYEYKKSTNTWTQRADIGSLIRQEAAGFSVNGRGYIIAGDNCSSGDNYQDVWEFDPNTDTWNQLEDFSGSARRYPDAFVIGKKAYVGLGTSGVNYSDLWEFDQTLSVVRTETELLEIKVYPNPITENATFSLNNTPSSTDFSDYGLIIYSVEGKITFNADFTHQQLDFSRGNRESGTYIYVISFQNTNIRTGQLILK